MRPLLNGGTLGRQKANRNLLAPPFVARAGNRSRRGPTDHVMPTGASTSGRPALLRPRSLHLGAWARRTARAIHFRLSVASGGQAAGCELVASSTPFRHLSAGPPGAQAASWDLGLLSQQARAPLQFVDLPSDSEPSPPVAARSRACFASSSCHCCPTRRCRQTSLSVAAARLPLALAAERRYVGRAGVVR